MDETYINDDRYFRYTLIQRLQSGLSFTCF